MKCQSLFSGKNKKNISLSSAEFSLGMVSVADKKCELIFELCCGRILFLVH